MADGKLLAIYLNDHLAGATLGIELTRRSLRSNANTELGRFLEELLTELVRDREALETVMERLAVRRSPVKPRLALVAERLGRLKLNGQVTGYSPLSRVLELEGLAGGIGLKLQLWNALEQNFGETLDGFDFHALAARADSQGQRVEDLHLAAAQRALPSATAGVQGIP